MIHVYTDSFLRFHRYLSWTCHSNPPHVGNWCFHGGAVLLYFFSLCIFFMNISVPANNLLLLWNFMNHFATWWKSVGSTAMFCFSAVTILSFNCILLPSLAISQCQAKWSFGKNDEFQNKIFCDFLAGPSLHLMLENCLKSCVAWLHLVISCLLMEGSVPPTCKCCWIPGTVQYPVVNYPFYLPFISLLSWSCLSYSTFFITWYLWIFCLPSCSSFILLLNNAL